MFGHLLISNKFEFRLDFRAGMERLSWLRTKKSDIFVLISKGFSVIFQVSVDRFLEFSQVSEIIKMPVK